MLTHELDQAAGLRHRMDPRRSWSVAVTSGKGGVGKTSVAVNLALAWAQEGRQTCLLDGDLGLANVDVLLNLHPRYSLRDVILGEKDLGEVVVPGPAGLHVIPAASGIEALATLTVPAQRAFLRRLHTLDSLAEVVVMDTGAGISRNVLNLVVSADLGLIVTTPDPTALTDAYAMIKILTRQRAELPLALIVNMADHATHAQHVHVQLGRIIRQFLHREIPLAGWIPRDDCVERAVREQRPLSIYFPYARATGAIRGMARTLRRQRADGAWHGEFWSRLVDEVGKP
jgi:flagellar biosynthesis protein FlhG